jgi:hypothetical protein
MSTKVSIRQRRTEATRPGFHLYEDCIDELIGDGEPPVYLQFHNIAVRLETLDTPGATVTLVIPRALARELGLLSPDLPRVAQSDEGFQR